MLRSMKTVTTLFQLKTRKVLQSFIKRDKYEAIYNVIIVDHVLQE